MFEFLVMCKPNPVWPVEYRQVFSRAGRARRFVIDPETVEFAHNLSTNNMDLWRKMRRFAKPPFDSCYIQTDMSAEVGEELISALYFEGDCVYQMTNPDAPSEHCIVNRYFANRDTLDISQICPKLPDVSDLNKKAMVQALKEAIRVFETVFLLMHAPKGAHIVEKPAHRKFVKGKPRAFAAHSVITIDLSDKEGRHILANGSRGAVRAHEVRGHWMHINRVPDCSHNWREVLVAPDRPERWICDCGTMRIWRKPHEKGDASLGYVTHEYRVTRTVRDEPHQERNN